MTFSVLMNLLFCLWQKLIRPQLIEVHGVDGFVVGVQDSVRIQDELGVGVPGGGVLPAPFAGGIGVARAEEVLAGVDQTGVGQRAGIGCIGGVDEHLRGLLRVGAGVFVAAGGCQHKAAQEVGLLLNL